MRKKVSVDEFFKRNRGDLDNGSVLKTSFNSEEIKGKIKEVYSNIKGKKSALLLDSELDIIRKVGIREAARTVDNSRTGVFAVVLDGTCTISLVKTCEGKGVRYIGATNFGAVSDSSVSLVSL